MAQDGVRRGQTLDTSETSESPPEASCDSVLWWEPWGACKVPWDWPPSVSISCLLRIVPLQRNMQKFKDFQLHHHQQQHKVAPAEVPHWMGVRPIDVALFENGEVCLPQPAFGSLPIPAINLMSWIWNSTCNIDWWTRIAWNEVANLLVGTLHAGMVCVHKLKWNAFLYKKCSSVLFQKESKSVPCCARGLENISCWTWVLQTKQMAKSCWPAPAFQTDCKENRAWAWQWLAMASFHQTMWVSVSIALQTARSSCKQRTHSTQSAW